MKSSQEFFERLSTDEAFAAEINEALKAKVEAGENSFETLIEIAADRDYELEKEELEEMYNKNLENLSDEELTKVAGGTTQVVVVMTIYSAVGMSVAWTIGLNKS